MDDYQYQSYEEPIPDKEPWYRREQFITVARGLFFLFLFLGAVIIAMMLFLKKEVSDQEASRTVMSSVVFLNQAVPVSMNVNTDSLPDCKVDITHTNIVMLLDQSSSMEGIPLDREMEGAQRIVDEVDLANTDIAIVSFNDNPIIHSNWSNNVNELTGVLKNKITSTGGTDIAKALEQAGNLFTQKGNTTGQQNFALLFTDGGSDNNPAIQQAELLKQEGVKLFVVGLKGDTFDEDLLLNLIDEPEDLLVTDDPDEIANLFGQVASLIITPKLENLSISEPVNIEAFVLDTNSESTLGEIVMRETAIMDSGSIKLSYTVRPRKIGLHNIGVKGGNINFLDCEGQIHISELPEGPRIFVLPPLILLFLGYLLPLIAFGSFGFWPRKPEKVWRTPNISPDYEEPLNPLTFLSGVKKVKDILQDELSFSPTLIVGLGVTGYAALNSLKKHLLEAGEGKMPKGVRLLWIGAESPEDQYQDKLYLDTSVEQHVTHPEFDRINIEPSDPGISSRFSWWQHQNSDINNRAHGRMSFFYDVLFSPAKPLKKRLDTITNQFMEEGNSSYRVFIISSPAENASALMPDLVHWLRNNFSGKVNRVLPWLLLKPVNNTNPENLAARRFAAMREVQRFMVAPNQLMETESGKYGVQDGFLFDGCMVFDQSSNPDATMQSLIDSICDQILLLIEDGVAQRFDQDMTDFMGAVGNRQENSLFVTSNSFTFYLPVEPIRRVCEVRLLQDLFFASGKDKAAGFGILANKPVDEQRDGTLKNGDLSLAKDFLYWRHEDLDNTAFQLLADVVLSGWEEGVVDYFPRNLDNGYQWKLITYLNMLMNGTQKFSADEKSLGFWRARNLINQLNAFFEKAQDALRANSDVRGKVHAASKLMSSLANFKKTNDRILNELQNWQHAFKEERTNNATPGRNTVRRSFSSIRSVSEQNNNEGELKSLTGQLEALYQQRIAELNTALATTDTRSVVIDPQFLTDSDVNVQKIVDFYYHEYLLACPDNSQHELARFATRIGWHWDEDDDGIPTLECVVLPEKSSGEHLDTQQTEQVKYGISDFVKLSQNLFALAPAFSRVLRTKMNLTELLNYQEREVGITLERERDDRLLNYSLLNDATYCQQRTYLLHPDETQAKLWSRQVDAQQFEIMQVKNKTRATGIWFVFKVPDSIITLLKSDKESYYGMADLHVFPAEQYAVEKEAELGIKPGHDELLHPRLVRMMNYNELFDAAIHCLLYGWMKTTDDDLGRVFYVIETDNISQFKLECAEVNHPETIEDAFMNMTVSIPWKCLDDSHPLHMNKLKQTIDLINQEVKNERLKPFEERQERYEHVDRIVQKWRKSRNFVERDLARLLEAMLKRESRY